MGTVFTVFCLTQPGIKPTTYQSQGRHSTTRPLHGSSLVAKCLTTSLPPGDWRTHGTVIAYLWYHPHIKIWKHPAWKSTGNWRWWSPWTRCLDFKTGIHKSRGHVMTTSYFFIHSQWFESVFPHRKTFAKPLIFYWVYASICLLVAYHFQELSVEH